MKKKVFRISCYWGVAFLLIFSMVISSCNSSKTLQDQPLSFKTFTRQFPELSLPYDYTIDSLMAVSSDSLQIPDPEKMNFIPDSLRFINEKGDSSTTIYAVGKGKTGENRWLFIKEVMPGRREVYVLIYDTNDSLLTAKKVASKSRKRQDKTLTFKWTENHLLNLYKRTDLGKGLVADKREVYSLSGDQLQLILTNKGGPSQ